MSTFPEPQIHTDPARGAEVSRDDRAHVFHSWSAQALINPLPIAAASGSHFWDFEGKRYLDFSSQLVNVNIGYQHPKLGAATQGAAARQCTIAPSFADESRSEAARLIAGLAPGTLNRVFFTNGGAEATENAMRMARLHTGRHKVLTTTDAEECERALQHLADVIMVEGASTIAAVMLETVVGTNGILVPPDGYLAGVREICDEHGIVWIADEVMAGFGRCGEWFAVDHWGVTPDLICFAKGVNSGYVPLGGVVISDAIADTFAERAFPGGLTYSGHPLACASAVASIRIFEEEGILENVRKVSDTVIAPRLAEIAQKHPSVGEVRGLGFFWALELVRDRETREPLVPYNAGGAAAGPMNDFAAACKAEGLWPFIHFNRTHVVPPCTTTADEMAEGLDILDRALDVADRFTA